MPTDPPRPYGALVLCLVALGLYLGLLVNALQAGRTAKRRLGMRSRVCFLHLFSGVAACSALDMCSRNMKGAVIFLVVTPLVTALHNLGAGSLEIERQETLERRIGADIRWPTICIRHGAVQNAVCLGQPVRRRSAWSLYA